LLSSAQLKRVIQRAAELQTARESVPDRLDDAEVMRIGEEVGLESQHVHRALLELRAESMVPSAHEERALPTRLWGTGHVSVSRVVPGDAHEVQNELGGYLRSAESLRRIRDRPGLSIWEPASDFGSQIKRSFDFGGHGYELAKARRVETTVQQLEPGRSLVTLSADLTNQRAALGGGTLFGLMAAGAALTLPLVFGVGLPLLLVAPVALGVGMSGGSAAGKLMFRKLRERVELAMQGLLDTLERGGSLPESRSIAQKISGFLDSIDDN
jgi:hypothetical protein